MDEQVGTRVEEAEQTQVRRAAREQYCPVCWEEHPRAVCTELTRGAG
jgi:hypothetical protein